MGHQVEMTFTALALREECPDTEFFLVLIFLHSEWIRIYTPRISVFSSNRGKYGPEKTPSLDTFHAVLGKIQISLFQTRIKKAIGISTHRLIPLQQTGLRKGESRYAIKPLDRYWVSWHWENLLNNIIQD